MNKYNPINPIPVRLFSLAFILLLLPTIINALLPQISLALFSRQVIPYGQLIIVGTPLLLFGILISQGSLRINLRIYFPVLIFVVYSLGTLLINLLRYDLDYLLPGYLNFYYFAFAILAASIMQPFFSYRITTNLLIWSATVCSILGITQYLANDPILAVKDSSGNFEILSWMFYETQPYRVRGFSLFSNALDFGVFLVFVSGILLFLSLSRSKWYFTLLIILIFAAFATLTRNVYIGMTLTLGATLIYRFVNVSKVLLVLPFTSVLLGFLISSGLNLGGDGLTSTHTLDIRSNYWSVEVSRQYKNDTLELLFGSGIYQSGGENSNSLLFVDNSYLQIMAQLGIIGMLLFLWIYWVLLGHLVSCRKNALRAGLYGFLIAWPAIANFNILITSILLYSFLVLTTEEDGSDNKTVNLLRE